MLVYSKYVLMVPLFGWGPQEARCMLKARKAGVRTPCLYQLDSANSKITMEKVDGITAKQFLLDCLQSERATLGLDTAPLGTAVVRRYCACL